MNRCLWKDFSIYILLKFLITTMIIYPMRYSLRYPLKLNVFTDSLVHRTVRTLRVNTATDLNMHQVTKNDPAEDQIIYNLKNDRLYYSPVPEVQAFLVIHSVVEASPPNTCLRTKRMVKKVTTHRRMKQQNQLKVPWLVNQKQVHFQLQCN